MSQLPHEQSSSGSLAAGESGALVVQREAADDEPGMPEIRFEFADVDEDDYTPGTLIDGRYELVDPIGIGGMGSVWRAHDFVLDIDVAVKLVRADRLKAVGMERLIREARATAAIQDPAVVRVHGFGTCEGAGYIAMELLSGRTLEHVLDEEGTLSEAEAVRLMLPVVDALAAAHRAGVIHRDVKPSNIMLTAASGGTTQPKLLDFGIAHHQRSAEQNRLTSTGQVLGTPYYMSFEQAAGKKDVDHRADIWATCCVIYELVAGVGPFDGDNYNAVLRAVLMDPPMPLSDVIPDVDPELWSLLERGLEKNREARWSSIEELGFALRRWLVKRGYRTDAAGRLLVTSDFPEPIAPTLDGGEEPSVVVRPKSAPVTVAMTALTSELADDHQVASLAATLPPPRPDGAEATDRAEAETPHGFSRPVRAMRAKPHRLAMAVGACGLMLSPLATVFAHATPLELDYGLTRALVLPVAETGALEDSLPRAVSILTTEAPADRHGPTDDHSPATEAPEPTQKVGKGARSSTASAGEAPASSSTPPAKQTAEPEARGEVVPLRPSEPRPKQQARRYGAGSNLPLPTAPRFR